MSNRDFVKGECRHCRGHLEFPADATGQTIPCPHCGQTTELWALVSGGPSVGRRRLAAFVALFGGLVAVTAALLGHRPHSPVVPPPSVVATPGASGFPATTAPPISSLVKTSGDEPRPGETVTNSFGISGGKMPKAPGSSLVYVTGTVRNLSDRQRFGVKVDYSLLDASGQVVGHATDYQSIIDPRGEWDFKGLVMESRAVSAQFNGITEQ